METLSPEPLDDDWWAHHFDYLSPQVTQDLYPALARVRARCPVAHSDQHGGHWVVTRYEDVLRVAQDWETFSSALGVGIPHQESTMLAIPEVVDPPLHRVYKRLINAYLTPAVVRRYEEPTRALIDGLIDEFIEAGTCDFMPAFARIFPGRAFFEFVLNAPSDQVAHLNDLATGVSMPTNPDIAACWAGLAGWIDNLVEQRQVRPRADDIVDAILHADIEGRPVTHEEVRALIVLLILGGLETTAGALGHFMIRFCQEPEIPALLRHRPELVPDAVEELLRLDTPFVFVGRTVRHADEIARQRVEPGDKVLISWAAANRDEAEFAHPDTFDLERPSNRHVAFGAGPHRCAGSNLARMNLRLAVHELVQRLLDTRLLTPVEQIPYHSAYNRAPQSLPISFTPGRRLATTPRGVSPR
jgi:cytochrome P450